MTELLKEDLIAAGVDVAEALARFMGNEELYERFLFQFPADPNFPELQQALARSDPDAALHACHALKGLAANLGMTRLARAAGEAVGQMRQPGGQAAKDTIVEVSDAYRQVCDALKRYNK